MDEEGPEHVPHPGVLGAQLLSQELLDRVRRIPVGDPTAVRHIIRNVDLSPLVREEEVNYVRLRYNEYLLQCAMGHLDLDDSLDAQQAQLRIREADVQLLRSEVDRAEAERRHSENALALEALSHQRQVERLEQEVAGLREEISRLRESSVGSGVHMQILKEVDGALQELDQLENDVNLRRDKLQELESAAQRKDEQLLRTREELEGVRSMLESADEKCQRRIHQLRDSIATKEAELRKLSLDVGALEACKAQLQSDLATTQREAQQLKDNVHEKDWIIDIFRSDNQKIMEELERLRQQVDQNDLVARKEMEAALEDERRLSQQLRSSLSPDEESEIRAKLATLERELDHKRRLQEQNKDLCRAMETKIKEALDVLDAGEAHLTTVGTHNQRADSARTMETLQERNRQVEVALQQVRSSTDGSSVSRAAVEGMDNVLDTLRQTNEKVNENNFPHDAENGRLLMTISELEAVDETLQAAEQLLLHRQSHGVTMAPTSLHPQQSLFLRYYPLLLTCLFLVLVVGGDMLLGFGGWNLWLPYILLAALSFALPHPFGAVASLLAAIVVAASFLY